MGCDIHSKVEVKVNGQWQQNTDEVFPNSYYLSDEKLAERQKDYPDYERSDFQKNQFQTSPSDGRDYDWFAILADVRNGRGFAGIKTGDGWEVIAEPKGIPEDSTEEWKKYCEDWGSDLHSISYLSVEEFDAFFEKMKEGDSIKEGVILIDEYRALRGTNESPDSWCGGISGGDIITLTQAQADDYLDGKPITLEPSRAIFAEVRELLTVDPNTEHGKRLHVRYRWSVGYKQHFNYKIKEYVEPMRKLKERYEDVRLVFGFDN